MYNNTTPIYLDNAATTRPSRKVLKVAQDIMTNDWYNPSSPYRPSNKVKVKIEQARRDIGKLIGFRSEDIIFTSGATESNNYIASEFTDVFGSEIEHDSVYNLLSELPVKVDSNGKINTESLRNSLSNSNYTKLLAVAPINNEIGVMQDINKIYKVCRENETFLHLDATQSMGKFDMNYDIADSVTCSAHKFHGLKGVGFLAVKDISYNINTPMMRGGHQEREYRPGTENVLGILTMAEAFKECYENMDENTEYVTRLRDAFLEEITSIPDIKINSDMDNPYIVSMSFKDINAESLVRALSTQSIYVSSGTACNTGTGEPSRVLKAIGLSDDYLYGTIRVSFDAENTLEEVVTATVVIKDTVSRFRRLKNIFGVHKELVKVIK